MTNPQEQQYTEAVKQAQDAMMAALETWTRTFQQALDTASAAAPVREHLIDQGFDFIGRLAVAQLNAQRNLAKQLAASGTAITEIVRTGTAEMTEALRGGLVLCPGESRRRRTLVPAPHQHREHLPRQQARRRPAPPALGL